MVNTGGLWKKVSQSYTRIENTNSRLMKYTCNFCAHVYAYNVTRMSGHILSDCPNSPQEVKNEIYKLYKKKPKIVQEKFRYSVSKSNLESNKNTRWINISQHFIKVLPAYANGEQIDAYKCVYCEHLISGNITKMTEHILECPFCPEITRNTFLKSNTLEPRESFELESSNNEENSFLTQESFPIASGSGITFDNIKIEEVCGNTEITEPNLEENSIQDPNSDEQDDLNLFARACFATNTPLNIFENEYWQRLLLKINPNVQLPTASSLTECLNEEYSCMVTKIQEKVQDAKFLGMQIHGLNKQNSPVVIVLTTPQPLVYKIINSNKSRNPDDLIETIRSIIRETIPSRILSIATNNLNTHWTAFDSKIPNLAVSSYVCNLHILKLFKKDLLNSSLFKKVFQNCSEVLEEIKNHDSASNFLDKNGNILSESKKYNRIETCIDRFVNCLKLLQFLAEQGVLKNSRPQIFNRKFWADLHLLQRCLHDLNDKIREMKKKFVCLSSVAQCYFVLNNKLKDIFEEDQSAEIMNIFAKYKKLALQDIHKAASLLNPKFMGNNLLAEEVIDAIAYINKLPKFLTEVKSENIIFEIAAYRTKQGLWGKAFVWDSLKTPEGKELPPIIWWQSMCASTEICKVAVAVLSCSATLAHLSKVEKFKIENDRKLGYVKHNLRFFGKEQDCDNKYGNMTEYWTDSESSDSEFDDE